MTKVRIGLYRSGSPSNVLVAGRLEWIPTGRRIITVNGNVEDILPSQFSTILDGRSVQIVDVPETNNTWAWRIIERVPSGDISRCVAVPQPVLVNGVEIPVDYASLVNLDPSTLVSYFTNQVSTLLSQATDFLSRIDAAISEISGGNATSVFDGASVYDGGSAT